MGDSNMTCLNTFQLVMFIIYVFIFITNMYIYGVGNMS